MNQRQMLILLLGLLGSSGQGLCGDLENILSQHYVARGGLGKLMAIQAMQYSGTLKKKGTKIAFTYTIQGERCRQDYVIHGKKLVRVFDGQKGWQFNPMICTEPQPLTKYETRKMRIMTDDLTGPLVNWKAKGHRLEYRGLQQVKNQPFHKIIVHKNRGQREIIYLDPKTYLEKLVVRRQNGGRAQYLAIKSFETLDGVIFVKEVVRCKDLGCCLEVTNDEEGCGSSHRIQYKIRTINPSLDDRFFVLGTHKTTQTQNP